MNETIVIAAAGRGTRMKELAKITPKHLIQVAGKPFLYYLLLHIYESGITKVIIVTGHLSDEFDKFIQQYGKEFSNLEIVNQYDKVGQEKYGSLMPLLAVQDIVQDKNFLMVNGDHLFSVKDLKFFYEANNDFNYLAATRVADPSKFGTLEIDDKNFLIRINEKSPEPKTNLINAGLYRFTPEIFMAAQKVEISPRGEYEITDAITALTEFAKVQVVELKDYWLDFGRPEDIAVAENIIANNFKQK